LADLRDTLRITHQTGARDREVVEKGYRACGYEPDVREFISDMSAAYAGAAVMIEEKDLTGEVLAREIRRILGDPDLRERMSRAAGRLGSPQASREIADVCTDLVRQRWGTPRGQAREPGFQPVRPPDLAS
ncbi:MAG TPA: UDP-N-acetylglucosamine--N-acetylmuramyl-(pentapeptide) pyrophosphoryl-undecaprenol N-acetylglucosamine transferase, partial [Anaeromyxobacteraceae bacterium]|nr:UDP-N-acetylglucosamine--N-acetylmuramyl-(pentapeptide) pyrophosphoryl-undecaprenol N-acetylglucosamine transferase [Anaeromyxobacteraceae bacterium]